MTHLVVTTSSSTDLPDLENCSSAIVFKASPLVIANLSMYPLLVFNSVSRIPNILCVLSSYDCAYFNTIKSMHRLYLFGSYPEIAGMSPRWKIIQLKTLCLDAALKCPMCFPYVDVDSLHTFQDFIFTLYLLTILLSCAKISAPLWRSQAFRNSYVTFVTDADGIYLPSSTFLTSGPSP